MANWFPFAVGFLTAGYLGLQQPQTMPARFQLRCTKILLQPKQYCSHGSLPTLTLAPCFLWFPQWCNIESLDGGVVGDLYPHQGRPQIPNQGRRAPHCGRNIGLNCVVSLSGFTMWSHYVV